MPDGQSTRREGRQRWRDLLFLHWAVRADLVRTVVPPALPLDLYDGWAWLSIVAFEVRAARPPLVPAPLGLSFLETNTRTYVRRPGGEPAVYFLSLDATARLAVLAARLRYGLPYHRAAIERRCDGGAVLYRLERRSEPRARLAVRYATHGTREGAEPGSLDAFLIVRHALHVVHEGRIRTVRVAHEPYPLRHVEADVLDETLLAAAGVPRPKAPPLVHFSDGVDADIVAVVAS